MESNNSSSLVNEPYFFLILKYLSQHANFVDKNIVINDVTTEIPSEEKRGIEAVYLFVQSQVEDTIDKMVKFELIDSEYRLKKDHQPESDFIKLSDLGREFLADTSDNSGTPSAPKKTSVDVSGGVKEVDELTLRVDWSDENAISDAEYEDMFSREVDEPEEQSAHSVLVDNHAIKQSIKNLQNNIRTVRKATSESNYLAIENEKLQGDVVRFYDGLDSELSHIADQIDLSSNPVPAMEESEIKGWFEKGWIAASKKISEFASVKKFSEIIVPATVIGACSILGLVVGRVAGYHPSTGISVGSEVGKVFTGEQKIGKTFDKIVEVLEKDKVGGDE